MPRVVSLVLDGTIHNKRRNWLGPLHRSVYPKDLCYLCEKTGAASEDHVIARGFFGHTVPEIPRLLAHKTCNSGYADAEEYVRNTLAQLDAATGDACEAARSKVLAALKPKYPNRRAQRKWEQQRRETGRHGERYTWLPEHLDRDLWQRAFWKMTRGIGFWASGRLCPGPEDCQWGTSTRYEWPPLARPRFQFLTGDALGVIATWAATDRVLTQGDLRFTFYQGVPVRVVFGMELESSIAATRSADDP
jgi:hypothetical protein